MSNEDLRGSGHRVMGASPGPDGRHTRFVDRYVIHGSPLDFRALCEQAVPPQSRYVVLDLDKTFHLDVNLGERLGWEIIAYQSYGREHLARAEHRRSARRGMLDWTHPMGLLRYAVRAFRTWALPGLHYLVWARIASAQPWLRGRSYRRFGLNPIKTAQTGPQTVLMMQLAELPVGTVHEVARAVWRRQSDAQVIDREDITWLRARCPHAQIIISSASPQPLLEIAAEELGVDGVIATTIEERGGFTSTPLMRRWTRYLRGPRRFAPPSTLRINSSHDKIRHLVERYPDMFDPEVITVGITDTGYGEDHCWGQHFKRVIDINSKTPFPPIVTGQSPLQEVHSAAVLTRVERDSLLRGEPFGPSRAQPDAQTVHTRYFSGAMLAEILGTAAQDVEMLARRYAFRFDGVAAHKAAIGLESRALADRLEAQVHVYNETAGLSRVRAVASLRGSLRKRAALAKRVAKAERPISELALAMTRRLERARVQLETFAPAQNGAPTATAR